MLDCVLRERRLVRDAELFGRQKVSFLRLDCSC